MITPVQQYSVQFNGDGVSTSLAVDASLAPISEDFRGNLPQAVLTPVVTCNAPGVTSPLAGVTAQLVGTTVTITFAVAPARYDTNSALIVYTATFSLQFAD